MSLLQSSLFVVLLSLSLFQDVEASFINRAGTSTNGLGGLQLEPRGQVAQARADSLGLEASSFCSSLIGIHDVTQTAYFTGPAPSTTTAVSVAPCIVTFRNGQASSVSTVSVTPTLDTSTITLTSTATTTSTVTTYPPTSTPAAKRAEVAKPDSKRTCTIDGLPKALDSLVCDAFSRLCSDFVHPQTTTVSITTPGAPLTVYSTTTEYTCSLVTQVTSTFSYTLTLIEPAPTTTTITTSTTSTTTVLATATGTPYGTNDCVNGISATSSTYGYPLAFFCGQTLTNYYQEYTSIQNSSSDCYQSCLDFGACDAFIYNIGTGQCILSNGAYGGVVANPGYDIGIAIF